MKKVVLMNDLDKAYYKAVVREKWNSVKNFVRDNKEILVVAIPAAASVCGLTIKSISKHANLRKEEHVKNEYCYDRSLGHYWELRRKLTNNEWIEIDKRKQNGERLSDILDSLKVLK